MKESSKIENMLVQNQKLDKDNIEYILSKSNNRADYLTLNYIEKSIINAYGKDFINSCGDKIDLLVSLMLLDDLNQIYNFYENTLNIYIKTGSNGAISSFNLVFITLMHISLKVIRKSAEE